MSRWESCNEGRADPACTAATRAAISAFARAAALALACWIVFGGWF